MNEKQLQNEQGKGWREMNNEKPLKRLGQEKEDLIWLLSGEQIGWCLQLIGKVGEEDITVMVLARTKTVDVVMG